MQVLSCHPGITMDEIQDKTGFLISSADDVQETPPPTERELTILREEVDPTGVVIGRG